MTFEDSLLSLTQRRMLLELLLWTFRLDFTLTYVTMCILCLKEDWVGKHLQVGAGHMLIKSILTLVKHMKTYLQFVWHTVPPDITTQHQSISGTSLQAVFEAGTLCEFAYTTLLCDIHTSHVSQALPSDPKNHLWRTKTNMEFAKLRFKRTAPWEKTFSPRDF